jgi:hypothetical protein
MQGTCCGTQPTSIPYMLQYSYSFPSPMFRVQDFLQESGLIPLIPQPCQIGLFYECNEITHPISQAQQKKLKFFLLL